MHANKGSEIQDGVTHTTQDRGLYTFIIIWVGHLVSMIGTGLTGFALGVWVYQQTNSVTQFALLGLFAGLPSLLLLPMAGAIIDRWDRRIAIITSHSGAAACTLAIISLMLAARLEVWHLYIIMIAHSAFTSIQPPAYSSLVTLLFSKQHYGRANGMLQAGRAIPEVISPLVVGILILVVPMEGIILIDFATYLFAILTLSIVRIPRPVAENRQAAGKSPLITEALYGWVYIKESPGLLALLLYTAAINFIVTFARILFLPMVLSFASASMLGKLFSAAGISLLAGSVLMSVWGGPKHRVTAILGFSAVIAITLILAGLRPNILLVGCSTCCLFFIAPIVNVCNQSIWQIKTPPGLQGRVFAMRQVIVWGSNPLAYVTAGPIADKVFEPLLATGGPLSASVGQVIGVGPGRGMGLLYIVCGVLVLLTLIRAHLDPRVRLVESEISEASNTPVPGLSRSSV